MSQTTTSDQLTVLLVHGAFADSSSWAGVIERLQAKGIKVIAAANPLRGLKSDSAYVGALIDEIPGPVLAVGHSYGGAVISNAATGKSNVVGLVFVAAFAPDEGEVLLEVAGTSKDSVLGTALVWGPATLVLLVQNRYGAAITMLVIGAGIASNIDNLVRPLIYRRVSNIHPMITLVGAFAGVKYFGLLGVLLGPLAIAYLFELLNFYRQEYGSVKPAGAVAS